MHSFFAVAFSSPRRGGGFVAHRVSGGTMTHKRASPARGDRRPHRTVVSPRCGAWLIHAPIYPPLTQWATNLPPHTGRRNKHNLEVNLFHPQLLGRRT